MAIGWFRILAMDRQSQAILSLQEKGNTVWISGFGLRDVTHVRKALEEKLSDQFRRDILAPADQQFNAAMADMTASSSNELYARWIGHLVGRLSILRAKTNGVDRESLQKMAPPPIPYLRIVDREADSDIKEKFARLYVSAVSWSTDAQGLDQELMTLQTQLQHLLKLKGGDPQWVISWAASQDSISPVTLKDYWGGESASSKEPSIPGLFSRKGKIMIDAFFSEIDKALADPAASSDLKAKFDRWYRTRAFEAWRQFIVYFPLGSQRLQNEKDWQQVAARIAGDQGPYFLLLNHVVQEFQPMTLADLPPWLQHMEQVRDFKESVAFWNYRQQIEKTAKTIADPSQTVQATTQTFSEQSTPGSSVFSVAFDSLNRLKAGAPTDISGDPAVWSLISGPLNFLWKYARLQTANHLQADWDSKVLAAATGLSGTTGLIRTSARRPSYRFSKEQAAPFVQWKPQQGFSAKQMFGASIPFNGAFFSFLNGAVWVSSVNELHVGVTALNPETSPGAARIPNVTRLSINCGGKDQVLSNRRLRVLEKSFNVVDQQFSWSPACGDTVLEITVSSNCENLSGILRLSRLSA